MTASIDMRYTSNMLLTDPVFRKKSDLAIGESVACKGNCVSVSLREGEAIHHWDAKLRLEWVKRDKTDHKINNALYAVTVPLDAAGYVAEALINGALDDDD
jgi:riboflavin synthase alpha subunit